MIKKYEKDGVVIVWISLDSDRKKLDDFIAKNQLPGPHLYDGKGWENEVARKFNVRGIPMNYLLDRDGKIVAKDLWQKKITEAVAAVVKGQKPPESKTAEDF